MVVAYRRAEAQEVHDRHEPQQHGSNVFASNRRPPIPSATDLEEALVHAIDERTGGRVRSLEVQIHGDRVVLRGWADSYHAVQLAIAGLREAFIAMDLDRPEAVEFDIEVLPTAATTGPSP
jgi:hypothetical protein